MIDSQVEPRFAFNDPFTYNFRVLSHFITPVKRMKECLTISACCVLLIAQAVSTTAQQADESARAAQKQRVLEWRKERDEFFRNHEGSPLSLTERKNFRGLKYYDYNPQWVFWGPIERYSSYVVFNDPKYHSVFLTNKGTTKRYIRYGRFQFSVSDKEYALEIFKSILSDWLFIPFLDKTNGEETYRGGRYIDAEILPEYRMMLDFNKAYCPPCAYNNKLICALPPRQNMLDIPIRAGEKND